MHPWRKKTGVYTVQEKKKKTTILCRPSYTFHPKSVRNTTSKILSKSLLKHASCACPYNKSSHPANLPTPLNLKPALSLQTRNTILNNFRPVTQDSASPSGRPVARNKIRGMQASASQVSPTPSHFTHPHPSTRNATYTPPPHKHMSHKTPVPDLLTHPEFRFHKTTDDRDDKETRRVTMPAKRRGKEEIGISRQSIHSIRYVMQ
ncbi:hypothetical protein CC78DRAFT_101901 [Lojkania enalia]|uniref:Uncharacterized protein n=1 Tax=Lojkania enalia TaxID=147567 RepID=A0A9P4N2A1_9PLEO|nr:hypothetical protein CC78DRAFT_101901 [Didymosphaeria enalia]